MKLIAFSPGRPMDSPIEEVDRLAAILPWVDALHIRREEALSAEDWKSLLDALPVEFRKKIWLHDHFDLAVEMDLGGVHVSRKSRDEIKGLNVFAALHEIGSSVSCHNVKDAAMLGELYDRVFICPLYDSISKPGHQSAFDMEEVRRELEQSAEAEFIALGGITADRVDDVRELGFDGLAVLGALWASDSPVDYIRNLHFACQQKESTY